MPRDDELEGAKQGEFDADNNNNNNDDVLYDVAHISYEGRDVRRAPCTMSASSRKASAAAAPPATSPSRAIRK